MDMNIDFKQMTKEDPEFEKFAKEIIYKLTIDMDSSLLALLYPMYAKNLPMDVAYDTVKMMIMLGGNNGKPRRNS